MEKKAVKLGLEKEAVKILILELSKMDGATFFSSLTSEIDENMQKTFDDALSLYFEKHLPIQHILGYSYFYGYKLKVSNQVLIPRFETEELVSYVMQTYDDVFKGAKVKVVDIGTGSGAIAVALAKEEPNFEVFATDISNEALEIAKFNAKQNEAKITFLQGDMLEPLIKENLKFDILVSNPPYIPDDEYVEDIVKNNEPSLALFGGKDGMHFYEIILKKASLILNPKNILLFEHSYSKKQAMLELAKKYFPTSKSEVIKDLNGKDRFLIIINDN